MKFSIILSACVALGLTAAGAEAATLAKPAHRQHHKPAAQPEAQPEAAPAEAAPAKVVEPDPVYFGHAGSGTKY